MRVVLDAEFHPINIADDGPAITEITGPLRRRRATDAAYVRLARRLETDVWTLDGPLARNAADIGLPVELIT